MLYPPTPGRLYSRPGSRRTSPYTSLKSTSTPSYASSHPRKSTTCSLRTFLLLALLMIQLIFFLVMILSSSELSKSEAMETGLELMVRLSGSSSPTKQLRVVWNYLGHSCTGFGVEATNFMLSLHQDVPNLKMMAEASEICPGMSSEDARVYRELYTKNVSAWDHTDIFILHKPPHQYHDFPFEENWGKLDQRPHYLIGRSMSETLNISNEWIRQLNRMDEVWVPSEVGKQVFVMNGVHRPIHVIHEPMDCAIFNRELAPLPLDSRGFRFASVFKWEPRKGYDVLLRAYFQEFTREDKVTLYIKTFLMFETNPNSYDLHGIMAEVNKVLDTMEIDRNNLPALHILTGELRSDHLIRLYKSVDAYVQPSRGEGWGLTITEAMAMGLPTIATGWGGQTEYMTPDNSYQIPIEGFSSAHGPCCFEKWQMWAEPSVGELQKLMRYVYENPDKAKLKGQQARQDMLTKYCRESVKTQVLDRFQEIGEILRDRHKKKDPVVFQ